MKGIPPALQMFDANGRLPLEGFLSDTIDMPIDICQGSAECMYSLPDNLRFINLKLPIGYAMNPGSFHECLDVQDAETNYCLMRIIGPQGFTGNPFAREEKRER